MLRDHRHRCSLSSTQTELHGLTAYPLLMFDSFIIVLLFILNALRGPTALCASLRKMPGHGGKSSVCVSLPGALLVLWTYHVRVAHFSSVTSTFNSLSRTSLDTLIALWYKLSELWVSSAFHAGRSHAPTFANPGPGYYRLFTSNLSC